MDRYKVGCIMMGLGFIGGIGILVYSIIMKLVYGILWGGGICLMAIGLTLMSNKKTKCSE